MNRPRWFDTFSSLCSEAMGRPMAFVGACLTIVAWGAAGPIFGFSDTWQLVINTATTVITFLMVFLVQHTQNRDTKEMKAMLAELLRVEPRANNALLALEQKCEEEIEAIRRAQAKTSESDGPI